MGRGRAPCCEKVGLNKGPWTPAEDMKLVAYIQQHGHPNWRALPKQAGLLRCGKSCRLRWVNYLRPDIKRGNFTLEEEETIIRLHREMGNKWSKIVACLPGRTDNEIKNVWNTHLKKRLEPKEPKPTPKKAKELTTTSSSSFSITGSLEETDTIDVEQIETPMFDTGNSSTGCSLESEMESCGFHEEGYPGQQPPLLDDTDDDQDFFIEVPDVAVEPELWSLVDDGSRLLTPEGGPVVHDGAYNNPTTSEVDSAREADVKEWLAYLEKELDLAETMDGHQNAEVEQRVNPWEACGGELEDVFDMVHSYFLMLPHTPSPSELVI